MSNMPLMTQELTDLMELLEKEMNKENMPLHEHEKTMLREALKKDRFKDGVEIVKKALRKRDEDKAADHLEDI